jgi:hypothetical protein
MGVAMSKMRRITFANTTTTIYTIPPVNTVVSSYTTNAFSTALYISSYTTNAFSTAL